MHVCVYIYIYVYMYMCVTSNKEYVRMYKDIERTSGTGAGRKLALVFGEVVGHTVPGTPLDETQSTTARKS